jgi:hypothetical protein
MRIAGTRRIALASCLVLGACGGTGLVTPTDATRPEAADALGTDGRILLVDAGVDATATDAANHDASATEAADVFAAIDVSRDAPAVDALAADRQPADAAADAQVADAPAPDARADVSPEASPEAAVDRCAGVSCTPSNDCHVAGCDPASGKCVEMPLGNGIGCNDGSACTQTDTCQGGTCQGSNPIVCSAVDQCHNPGSCDPSSGGCSTGSAVGDGLPCNDSNNCTSNDVCGGGQCAGTPVTCLPPGQCYVAGSCQPSNGSCPAPTFQLPTTPCTENGGQACDSSGTCQPAPIVRSTNPADATSGVVPPTDVSVTFSTPMNPATLSAQTTAGACSGTVQVSLDGFGSCIALSSGTPVLSPDGMTATFTPQPGLLVNRTHQIRVTSAAANTAGLFLSAPYTQPSGFTTGTTSGAENESGSAAEIDYCLVQFPTSLTVTSGTDTGLIYGRVFKSGITPSGGTSPIIAQVGYGPVTANPEYAASYTWFATSYNASCLGCGNNDEYMGSFTAPAPGTYWYLYRFSLDGVTWTYCDIDGAGSDAGFTFDLSQIPVMTVN